MDQTTDTAADPAARDYEDLTGDQLRRLKELFQETQRLTQLKADKLGEMIKGLEQLIDKKAAEEAAAEVAKQLAGRELWTTSQYHEHARSMDKAVRFVAHRRYYSQFVTDGIRQSVLKAIGKDRLLATADPYLNDIDLSVWLKLCESCEELNSDITRAKCKLLDDAGEPGTRVCIVKEAARQVIEQHRKEISNDPSTRT